MEFLIELGLFVILTLFALPVTIGTVWHYFPKFNIVQASAVGLVIYCLIYLVLQKIFGRGSFN